MPRYEHYCQDHGEFEVFRHMEDCALPALCPECGVTSERLFSVPCITIDSSPRLKYGSGSASRMIPSAQTGGVPIYIASEGAIQNDEMDYLTVGAIENEKARVKKRGNRQNKQLVSAYTELARRAPKGQRIKTLRAAMAEA
jgi:putative FmdB family regulatory protein